MQQRVQDGFRILLPAADAVRLFGDNMKLYCIAAVSQDNHSPRLITNLLAQPNEGTPIVNNTKYMEVAPESMLFGLAFPRIILSIWEVDPYKGLVQVLNMEVIDAYHRGKLHPSQVGAFYYVIPLASDDDFIIICINLVLPMGWVDSTK